MREGEFYGNSNEYNEQNEKPFNKRISNIEASTYSHTQMNFTSGCVCVRAYVCANDTTNEGDERNWRQMRSRARVRLRQMETWSSNYCLFSWPYQEGNVNEVGDEQEGDETGKKK